MEASRVQKLIKSAPVISKRINISKLTFIRSKLFAYILAGMCLGYPIARLADSNNMLGFGMRPPYLEDNFKAHPDFLTGKVTIYKNASPVYNPYF